MDSPLDSQHTFQAPIPAEVEPFSKQDLESLEAAPADGATEERPEWLPEKFQSAEALAEAYTALEAKMGAQPAPEPAPATAPTEDSLVPEGFWDQAAASYTETGEVSADQLKTITDLGIPEPMIKTYMAGLDAIIKGQEREVYESVGGEENYSQMMEWAGKTMSQADQEAHNRVVDQGDAPAALMAIRGLYAQYKQATAAHPEMITGQAPQFPGVAPFEDRSQVTAAMRDPRYRTSEAYRKEVERRLAVTNIFG